MLGALLIKEGKDDELLPTDELLEVKKTRSIYVLCFVLVGVTISGIVACFIEEDLRRLRFGKDKSKPKQQEDASPKPE